MVAVAAISVNVLNIAVAIETLNDKLLTIYVAVAMLSVNCWQ